MTLPEKQPEERECPSCGRVLKSEFAFCPSCGETLSDSSVFAGFEDQDLAEFITSANQYLSESGTNAAESAFGLGCYLGFIPVVLLLLILFLFGLRNWIILALIGLGAVLIITGIAALLSRRARATNIRTAYYREVEPQIESYLNKTSITRGEFISTVRELLPEDAPLLEYIKYRTA